MDARAANELASSSCCGSSENAEISIDKVVAAVARLNVGVLRLRKEIVALKSGSAVSSVLSERTSLSFTPAGFNRTAKNGENRTGAARCGPRRNSKGDDAPSGTDLSARLSLAKRAREVKAAADGAAVFKEDYPRDDKSIGDDERPNRSRVSEPLGTYRKSISDAEKSAGEGADEERPGGLNERRNEVEAVGRPANFVSTPRIRRKRISRGVQCAAIGRPGRSFLSCFKPRGRNLARRPRRRGAAGRFDAGSGRNGAERTGPRTISDVAERERKSTTDTKGERFGKIGEEGVEEVARGNYDEELRAQVPHDGGRSKDNDDSKYGKVKLNLLGMLRLRRASAMRNDDSKAGRSGSPHEGEIVGLGYGGKRTDGVVDSRDVKIIDRRMDSSNGRGIVATVDRGSDVNKIKERLDSCITELNGIIGDACAIFGNRRKQSRE